MAGNIKEEIKNTKLYKEMQQILKEYYDVLSPISEALFGDMGKQEFAANKFPFAIKYDNKNTGDLGRDGVTYGIAACLAAGMSIDDIFNPTAKLDEKRQIGENFLQHIRNNDHKSVMEIYIKATERVINEVPLQTEDNLVDNLRDVKALMFRKLIFDINQRFGLPDYGNAFDDYFTENYPTKEEADAMKGKIYSYVDKIQAQHHAEVTLFAIITEAPSVHPVIGHMTNFEGWKRMKEDVKNIKKEMTDVELQPILEKRTMIDIETVQEFEPYKADLEEFIIEEFNKDNPFENTFEDARKFLFNKFMDGKNPEEYAKSAFEDQVKQALGDLNLDDVLNAGFNRILINGKPLEFPKNASNAFVEQSLYNQLAEAVVAGRKITYFAPNAETGVLEANEMKVSFNKYVKAQFKANGPKTSISKDPKMKADDLAAAEAAYLENLQTAEKIYSNPEIRTLMDAKYHDNLVANLIAQSIFGEEGGRDVRYGETLNFMATGLNNQGDINLAGAGVAYAVAKLLADGMSMADILDIDKESGKKLEAGRYVQELAAKGDDGHKELSALAEQAMQIIHNEKYRAMSDDMVDNASNFYANFAAQIMHELKKETNDKVLQSYADSYEIVNYLGQKPGDPKVGSINEWALEYLSTSFHAQTFNELAKDDAYGLASFDGKLDLFKNSVEKHISSYSQMAEALGLEPHEVLMTAGIGENAGLKTDVAFQKACFEALYNNLEAVDPAYIISSSEFRGMKKSLQDILQHYEKTEQAGSKDWYYSLEEKCNALAGFNEKYLQRKEGIEMKDGSNAQKRFDFATAALQLTKAAQDIGKEKGRLFATIDFQGIRNKMAEKENDLAIRLDVYDKLVGPTYKVSSVADPDINDFMQVCAAVKKEENDFKVPDNLHITDRQAGFIVMMSVGTIEVSGDNDTLEFPLEPNGSVYATVSTLCEDVLHNRKGYHVKQMPFIEKGRSILKKAFEEYENGHPEKLAKILAEGMKRYASTFSTCENGYYGNNSSDIKPIGSLEVGAAIYDMVDQNDEIKALLTHASLGDDKITQHIMETYRGAKMAYVIYNKAEVAKKDLLDMIASRETTPDQTQKMKEALAAIVLKNIFNKEMETNYKAKDKAFEQYIESKYGVDEDPATLIEKSKESMTIGVRFSMGKYQREFTSEKMQERLQILANSKTIDKMVKSLDANKLKTMFEREKEFFESTLKNMIKNEPEVVKEKEPKPEKEQVKENVNNELPFVIQ